MVRPGTLNSFIRAFRNIFNYSMNCLLIRNELFYSTASIWVPYSGVPKKFTLTNKYHFLFAEGENQRRSEKSFSYIKLSHLIWWVTMKADYNTQLTNLLVFVFIAWKSFWLVSLNVRCTQRLVFYMYTVYTITEHWSTSRWCHNTKILQ